MINIPVWILTFDRPKSLNRLLRQLADQEFVNINILSNHPDLYVESDIIKADILKQPVINTLNDVESNSWCTRSWNTVFLKNFKHYDEIICIQDDTTINPQFGTWIAGASNEFDFVWGPAGDQFFYAKKSILRTVGWWDERYLACFCGDADWMRRVYYSYDNSKLSIEERHQWGFTLNPTGIGGMVNDGDARQWNEARGGYLNQCQQFEKDGTFHPVLKHCQDHYYAKWGVSIDAPIDKNPGLRQFGEIDWYPWFTKKYMGK